MYKTAVRTGPAGHGGVPVPPKAGQHGKKIAGTSCGTFGGLRWTQRLSLPVTSVTHTSTHLSHTHTQS